MYAQIVTFNLSGMTDAEFLTVLDEVFVPALVKVPGLLAKTPLRDVASNTYCGVYTWRDKQAMQDYLQSDLYRGFTSNPNFANIISRDFDLIEGPARLLNGLPASAVLS